MEQGVKPTTYKCKNCGGEVRFDVDSQKLLCTACRAEYIPQSASDAVYETDFELRMLECSDSVLAGVKTVTCDTCGGEIFFNENETAARCPMCGGAKLRVNADRTITRPDAIIPFKVSAVDAQNRFRKFISSKWFAPSSLKHAYEEGRLEGWYIPYWTFDAEALASYAGEAGKNRTITQGDKKVTVTDWTPVNGRLNEMFDDVLVCATRSESARHVGNVNRFDTTRALVPYSQQYLQGYLAEYRSLEARDCFITAKVSMDSILSTKARNAVQRGCDTSRNVTVSAVYKNVTCKSILLPIYRAVYSFKGVAYDYIINGQTGAAYAKYPKSAGKIILAVAIAAAIIAGIVFLASR